MERRRYIGRIDKDFFESYTSDTIRVDTEKLSGYAAHIKIDKAKTPFIVGEKGNELCIGDTGYSRLNYMPDNENWALCAIYDNHDKIVEWYFDITRKNALDENGEPYCDDLYLDVALMPDGRVLVFDEDELQDAHKKGTVTANEMAMAYRVKDTLIEMEIVTVAYMETLCAELLALFKKQFFGS